MASYVWLLGTVVVAIVVKFVLIDRSSVSRVIQSTVKLNASYDYIIVGGGSAGCVLAGRLSEDSNVTVLLLEAGPDDTGNEAINIPLMGGKLWKTGLDWDYYSEKSDVTMKGLLNGVGISYSQVNSKNSQRWSTSFAFVHSTWDRANLHVATDSHVTQVLIENHKAKGVAVIRNGRKQIIHANKEIILSAGAIGSPQLLMLSGIGPKAHLESLRIPVLADLPVGENLQDHVMFEVGFFINQSLTATARSFASVWNHIQYKLFGTGPLASAFLLEALAFKCIAKETKSVDWPDLEIHFFSMLPTAMVNFYGYTDDVKEQMAERREDTYGGMCMPTLLRPESRGKITLTSRDPFDYPDIEPNYLKKQQDIELLIAGVQECEKFVNTDVLKAVGAELSEKKPARACEAHRFKSHEYWQCLIKHRPLTVYHPVGTCKMGPANDSTAVVDPELRVKGISNLRVVDASVMPWIISANTQAATIMIAEKAADLIRGRQPLQS
ncbi:hypothetical protein Btru_067220 [Bulinus truncatus]|nr:hypothetical protein Btru_067220 [Bulinus truncatus]